MNTEDDQPAEADPVGLALEDSAPQDPAAPEMATIEVWAERKGMLPQWRDAGSIGGARLNPKFPLFSSAKAFRNWPEGAEVSEQDFDAAVKEANEQVIR